MPEDRDLGYITPSDDRLAHRLSELGQLMREQEGVAPGPDPAFVQQLRARLAEGKGPTRLRRPGARPIRPARRPYRDTRLLAAGGLATAVAALLVLLIVNPFASSRRPFQAPSPTRADLISNLPAPPSFALVAGPTSSLARGAPRPYRGHLHLKASRLPASPRQLPAFQLAPGRNVVPYGRRILHIQAPVHRKVVAHEVWMVAADGGYPSLRPLHSLAVSLRSGELIYHDRRNYHLRGANQPIGRRRAVTIARRWLTRLGWPASRMPLRGFGPVAGRPKLRQVTFGWIGVRESAVSAATLWVSPDRSVIEVQAWPPAGRRESIPATTITSAWDQIRREHVPLVVRGVARHIRAGGSGLLKHVAAVSMLVPDPHGRLYLAPAFRFQGVTHLRGLIRKRLWVSLASGAKP